MSTDKSPLQHADLIRIASRIVNRTALPLEDIVDMRSQKDEPHIITNKDNPLFKFFQFIKVKVRLIQLPLFSFADKTQSRAVYEKAKQFARKDCVNLVFRPAQDVSPEWVAHDFWHGHIESRLDGSDKDLTPSDFNQQLNQAIKADFGEAGFTILQSSQLWNPQSIIPLCLSKKMREVMPGYQAAASSGLILDLAADLGILYFVKKGKKAQFDLRYQHNMFYKTQNGDVSLSFQMDDGFKEIPCEHPDLPNLNKVFNAGLNAIFKKISDLFNNSVGQVIDVDSRYDVPESR